MTRVSLIVACLLSAPSLAAPETDPTPRGPNLLELPYQGRLDESGSPANGLYDFQFLVVDSLGGTVDGPFVFDNVPVEEGLFRVTIPIDTAVLSPTVSTPEVAPRLLRLAVRPGTSTGPFTTLSPDQAIDSTAYAYAARTLLAPVIVRGVNGTLGAQFTVFDAPLGGGAFRAARGSTSVSLATPAAGLFAETFASEVFGIFLRQNATDGTPALFADSTDGVGIAIVGQGNTLGVEGIAQSGGSSFIATGVSGEVTEADFVKGALRFGVSGLATGSVEGANVGVAGYGEGDTNELNIGVYGFASGEAAAAGYFDGDVVVRGGLFREYLPLNPVSALPVAFGTISNTGAILSGSGNFTVVWNPTFNRYEISIDNTPYIFSNFSTTATPIGSSPRMISTSSATGRLLVQMFNTSGIPVQNIFSFTVHRAEPLAGFKARSDGSAAGPDRLRAAPSHAEVRP